MSSLPTFALTILLVLPLYLAHALYRRYARLYRLPGPFLANFTDAWRLYQAWKIDRDGQLPFQATDILFPRYGEIVRIGPNAVLVNDPDAVPVVMGTKSRLDKGPMVDTVTPRGGASALTGIRDEQIHAKLRRPAVSSYSLTSIKGYEGSIDDTLRTMIQVMLQRTADGEVVNLSDYLHYWAFDTIAQISWGKPLGFLKEGYDFNGMIAAQKGVFKYFGIVGQWPELDPWLKHNRFLHLLGFFEFTPIVSGAGQIVAERLKGVKEEKSYTDILASLMAARERYPEELNDDRIRAFTIANLTAGSNATASAMDGAALYFVRHPEAWERLYREVTEANLDEFKPDAVTDGPVHLDYAFKLPFLVALTNESLRMGSLESVALERIVSPAGMKLPDGTYLPPGTNVGINPCAMLRREKTFGRDAQEFRPERWLQADGESEEAFAARKTGMEKAMVQFGHGSRGCLGQNIVVLELYKIWPTLVKQLKFEPVGEPKLRQVRVKVHKR